MKKRDRMKRKGKERIRRKKKLNKKYFIVKGVFFIIKYLVK